eukprot:COSAG02_NODE_34941_length_476_cov_0.785146_1_plen_46_part_00
MLDAAVPNVEIHLYGNGVHGAGEGIPLSGKPYTHTVFPGTRGFAC